jgi:hypothetical protein
MADILITDLTDGALDGNNDWSGSGVFDKLIEAVNKNIEGQYNKGRISGSDYANVYLGSMQSVLAQSMQYLLQEKSIEADIALKEKQLEKVDEEIDLLQTQDLDVQKSTEVKERQMIEAELTGAKQRTLLDTEEEAKQYEVDNMLPEQLQVLYVDRVLKDKQAAKLGLDDVMKIAEKARSEGDGTVVYTPRYIG